VNIELPRVSAYTHPSTNDMIFVMVGKSGYWPKTSLGIVDDTLTADKWNEAHEITKAEAEAMFAGSMWGWDTPAADPENYDVEGSMLYKPWLDA
jgi:hypothetical protein